MGLIGTRTQWNMKDSCIHLQETWTRQIKREIYLSSYRGARMIFLRRGVRGILAAFISSNQLLTDVWTRD